MVVLFQDDHRDQKSDEVPKNIINGGDSSSSISGGLITITKQEKMTDSASQKHALSERERRKRINNHYDSLRKFFPRLHKTDKASVLAETVRYVKELKKLVANVAMPPHEDGDWSSMHQPCFIPGEEDEVSLSCYNNGDKTVVRAIICCKDRLDLNRGLMEAIHSVHGKAVKAEMATVGGRTKVDVMVEWPQCGDREDVGLLRSALQAVVENRIVGRSEFIGHGSTEPEFIRLGRRFVDGLRPNGCKILMD